MTWSYLYDFLFLLIFALCCWRGWRSGLLASLLRILGWVAAAFLAARYAEYLANWLFGNFLDERVTAMVAAAIPAELIAQIESGALAAQDALGALQEVLNSLSGFLGSQTVDLGGTESILALVQEKGHDLADTITQTILRPVLVSLLRAVVSAVIFLVCLWLFKLLARWSARHHRRHGKGLGGGVNSILGALAGLVEALALAYLYALILSALAGVVNQAFLNPEVFESTWLVSLLVK